MSADGAAARPVLKARLVAYITTTTVLAVAAVVGAWTSGGPPREVLALVILSSMGVLSQSLRARDVGARVTFSFLSIILLASIPILGPVGAAVVAGLTHILDPQRIPPVVRLFNTMMHTLLGVIGGLVYYALGGPPDVSSLPDGQALLVHLFIPLLLADAAQMLVNAALIAGIMQVDRGVPFRLTFVGMVSNSGVAYLGYGVIGFLFVVLWKPAGVGPFSALLILAPLFVARWAFVQYADEVRSHESALAALVTAVETKDPYAEGHSARLARLVDWLIEPLKLSSQEVTSLRFAAMLHDIGKVSLPTRMVRESGGLDRHDLLLLTEHAARGAELLEGVTFLEESLRGIRHHHERWDGKGYPDGLRGADIPMASRVIAVADAFDSLTMARPHRAACTSQEAVSHIVGRAGTQFDPLVVDALVRALGRHQWEPGEVDDEAIALMAGYFDHDDPEASDLYAREFVPHDHPAGPRS
jgi:HD-GYP domain-containing protein (c-di-GMP phosphodiesterase class II)